MEICFLEVVRLSYIGSIVIGIIFILRFFMQKLPKKFSYFLWAIPGIRLLCPISFRGLWGVLERHGGYFEGAAGNSQTTLFTKICSIVWLAGLVFFMLYNVAVYIRLRWRLQASVKLREHIFLADGIVSPFVMGIFSARIYLPSEVDWERYPEIIAHEEIHCKRHDHLFKLLAYGIVTLHWFNPVVWTGFFFFVRDMEMSCDEAVVSNASGDVRKKYAMALLDFSAGKNRKGISVSFSERNTKRRIKNLMRDKKKSKFFAGLAGAIVLAAAILLIPDFCKSDAETSKKAVSEIKTDFTNEDTNDAKEALNKLANRREYAYPTDEYRYEISKDKMDGYSTDDMK